MAAAVLRDVGRQLEAALSSGRSFRLGQLVDVCFDRLNDLHTRTGSRGSIVAPEVVYDTQLVFNLGKLLGLVLEQYSNIATNWANLSYCRMVGRLASAFSIVFSMADSDIWAPGSQQYPVFAKQLAASSLLPGLVATLPDLAEAAEAATELRPCTEKAFVGVLGLVFAIFKIWPGGSGVLRSRAAGPLVQPTLRLLVACFQYAVATNDAAVFEAIASSSIGGITTLAQQLLEQTDGALDNQQQRRQLQDHPYLKDLCTSAAFLTSLLTVGCMVLHLGTSATAAALAAELGGAAAAAEADQAAPADRCDRLDHSCRQCIEPLSAESKQGHPGGDASDPAAPQQQAELQLKVAAILQDLYGQSDTASSWQLLLSVNRTVTNFGCVGIVMLREVMSAAAACMQQLNTKLQRAAAAVDVHSSSEQRHTQLSLPQQQLLVLQALRQLPVVLLGVLCSTPAPAATRVRLVCSVHRAAISFVKEVVIGWGLQLELQSSSVGIQVEELPCAELLKVLLQHFDVLHQMKLEVAAALATAQSTADGAGSSLQTSADASSAVEAEADPVTTLDIAMVELLEVLALLQTVSQYAVWQPHVHQVADAVEHCLRSTSGGSDAAATLFAHHCLGLVCQCFLWHGAKTSSLIIRWADSERQFVVKDSGSLLRAAAAAAPGSLEQQQLFTIVISLLKNSSSFQRSGHAADELESAQTSVGRIAVQVARHMLDTLCIDSNSRPSALAALPHGMASSKLLCAAAPWLVASSRLVLHTATQLADSLEALEDQPQATSADGPFSSSSGSISGDVGAQTGPGSDLEEQIRGDHLRRVLRCNECLLGSAVRWIGALEVCCKSLQTSKADGRNSSTGSDRDVTAVHDNNASVMAASTVTAGAVAAGPAAVPDAVQNLQQAVLQEAYRALQSETSPAPLTMLHQVCSAASPDWQRETEAGEHVHSGVFAAAAAAGAPRADLATESSNNVVEYDLKQLLQDLIDVGQRLCAAFPLKYCCNNPVCSNVSKSNECALVRGRSCVCAGCESARYCSRECQAGHWPWHKAICKVIKKQSQAKQQC